jgi:hypothetical protein
MIPIIPVLEEEEEEAELTTVAEAPKVRSMRVQSMMELDQDLRFSLPAQATTGIDIGLLTSALPPQSCIEEPDEEWQFEILLQEVARELTEEQEAFDAFKKEEEEAGRAVPGSSSAIKSESGQSDGDGGGREESRVGRPRGGAATVDTKVEHSENSEENGGTGSSPARERRQRRRVADVSGK